MKGDECQTGRSRQGDWPTEFGGTGWSPVYQSIFDEERAGCYGLPYQPAALQADYQGAVAGPEAFLPLSGHYFNNRKVSIYGGSNKIQKNIVSRMILGL